MGSRAFILEPRLKIGKRKKKRRGKKRKERKRTWKQAMKRLTNL